MKSRQLVHSLVRIGFVGALLLSSSGRLMAQDDIVQPADSAETAAMPLPAEFSEESASEGPTIDPNAAATEDTVVEDHGDTTVAGPETSDDPDQFDAVENTDLGEASLLGGPEVDENGEVAAPIAGAFRLFLPSLLTEGSPATAETASAAEPLSAGMSMETAEAGGAAQVASSQNVMGDFNGDGRSDLAVGVPYEDLLVGGVNLPNAGAINVIYGSAAGLNAAGNQVWTQNSAGVGDLSEAGDFFGWALAAGNFNGDGFDDLAISTPYEDFSGLVDPGAVHILYGSAAGLTAAGNQIWTQNTFGVLEIAETGDLFGLALTASDFNGDGRDDLATGVAYEDIGGFNDAGLVHILYGSAGGLAMGGNQIWHQSIVGILDTTEAGDLFGRTLATGDFETNGLHDLAVGVAYEDVGALTNAGVVQIIRGTAAGLAAAGNQRILEDTAGVAGVSEANDFYGWALAAGDFNANGTADLAIGVPYEDFGLLTNAGTVNVIYSAAGVGLTPAVDDLFSQDSAGFPELADSNDLFGFLLSAARFNPISDLVIGVPAEDLPGKANAGAIHVVFGPLNAAGHQLWTQDSAGVLEIAEANDQFGLSLAVGDFNGNGWHDLVIGAPYEDLGGVLNMGAVNVIYGPLGAVGQQFWSQNSAGILEVGEANDNFGYTNQ